MKYLKIVLILSLSVVCFSSITISYTKLCQCSQFEQDQCTSQNTFGLCNWNTVDKICSPNTCDQMQNQYQCLSKYDSCFWNGQTCQSFTNCTNLQGSDDFACFEQNLQCTGFTGNCTSVQLSFSLSPCNYYNYYLCGQPGYEIGSGGEICFLYNNYYCEPLTSCSLITLKTQCQKFSKFCYWQNNQCVTITCSHYKTANQCKFVFSLISDELIPCIYTNNQCTQITSTSQLNQTDCSSSTLFNYRWVESNDNGVCLTCAVEVKGVKMEPQNRCPCDFFFTQSECETQEYCQWSQDNCVDLSCSQIKRQQDCIENYMCAWSNNQCLEFSYCYRFTSLSQCLLFSLNCPIYNSNEMECSQPNPTICTQYQNWQYGCQTYGNGFCNWNSTTYSCSYIASCNEIKVQTQCDSHRSFCRWQNNSCETISCSSFLKQQECKFVQTSIYDYEISPCVWENNVCQPASATLTLSEDTCQVNTDYTYIWAGSKCVSCELANLAKLYQKQFYQCPCTELQNQQDCLMNTNCQYTYQCIPQVCNYYTQQIQCAQNKYCFWFNGACKKFEGCEKLTGASQVECLSQSTNCPVSQGNSCLSIEYLQDCSTFQQNNQCNHSVGKDGQCIWSSGQCGVLSQCSQLTTQAECFVYSHSCIWDTTDNISSCLQMSCSSYTSPSTCTYYYSSINSITPISCYWSSNQNRCLQVSNPFSNQQLNSNTCFTNTQGTSTWSQNLNACMSCKKIQMPNPFQCECQQLISQINCNQMVQCLWNSTTQTCSLRQCSGLDQMTCIQNPSCMYLSGYCQNFTSCSILQASTQRECALQSVYCSNYQNGSCQNVASILEIDCSSYQDQQSCQSTYSYQQNINCEWLNNKCQKTISIYCGRYGQEQCDFVPTCYYSGNSCMKQQCNMFTTKFQCTFVLSEQKDNFIQSCEWHQGSCRNAQNHQLLSQEQCLTNTNQTWRWSSNTTTGYCIPCQLFSLPISPANECACSQIQNESECNSTKCTWYNNQCTENDCYAIHKQSDCINMPKCYWNLKYEQCTQWNIINCTTLKGQNSLECFSQSRFCPVSLNGICQDQTHLVTCSSYKNQQFCENNLGQEGYCNYQNQQCEVLTSCNQLKTINKCLQFSKVCQWINNGCTKLYCSSITVKSQCDYIVQNLYEKTVQICEWISKTNSCQSQNYIIDKTQSTCYVETGGTYHWSTNNNQGSCITCSINLIRFKNTCSCNSLSEIECLLAFPGCVLNTSNNCENNKCQYITNSITCSQQANCMWQYGICTNFTNCTDLFGNTNIECYEQSYKCAGISNRICQPTNTLSPCSSQNTNQQLCNIGSFGQDGLCYWNTISKICDLLSDCSQIKTYNECNKLVLACKWSPYFSNCVPFECQDYKTIQSCTHIIVNLVKPQVEICIWQNQICQSYEAKDIKLTEDDCFVKSGHTYRWIDDGKKGEKCQQCSFGQHYFVGILLVISLLLIN